MRCAAARRAGRTPAEVGSQPDDRTRGAPSHCPARMPIPHPLPKTAESQLTTSNAARQQVAAITPPKPAAICHSTGVARLSRWTRVRANDTRKAAPSETQNVVSTMQRTDGSEPTRCISRPDRRESGEGRRRPASEADAARAVSAPSSPSCRERESAVVRDEVSVAGRCSLHVPFDGFAHALGGVAMHPLQDSFRLCEPVLSDVTVMPRSSGRASSGTLMRSSSTPAQAMICSIRAVAARTVARRG
jgi:hypothetical protein